MRRRTLLAAVGLAPCAALAAAPPLRVAAAWSDASGELIGVLHAAPAGWRVAASTVAPTRAHGLVVEPGGSVLAVARRPGDWLLRFDAQTGRVLREHWIEPDRCFTGHAALDAAAGRLYTGQTELGSGAGVVGVRDANTLARLDEWPTHGIDPHELLLAAPGELFVANGGVPTQAETGRTKRDLDRMDSSLVRLSTRDGRLVGQWRLDDRRLSLRHLARRGVGIGVALQAEHDDAALRRAAPVLALFDGRSLRVCASGDSLAGYGGDIAAGDGGWSVSAPRAGAIGRWSPACEWIGAISLDEACALAEHRGGCIAGGRAAVVRVGSGAGSRAQPLPAGVRLDNHWLALR